MRAEHVLDVSELPDYNISSQHPLWWGQLFLGFIEGTLFLILIAMYFYMRLSVDVWPPPGVQLPHRLLPTISLIILVVSCLGSYWASEAAKKDDRAGVIRGLVLNLALAAAAMAVRAMAWSSWNFTWRTSGYGSITWAILFIHSLDVVADLLFTVVLIVIFVIGVHGPKQRLGVHVDSVVWYFLVAIWVPLYFTVYWGPYVVGGPQ